MPYLPTVLKKNTAVETPLHSFLAGGTSLLIGSASTYVPPLLGHVSSTRALPYTLLILTVYFCILCICHFEVYAYVILRSWLHGWLIGCSGMGWARLEDRVHSSQVLIISCNGIFMYLYQPFNI